MISESEYLPNDDKQVPEVRHNPWLTLGIEGFGPDFARAKAGTGKI